jgi:phage shock protein E
MEFLKQNWPLLLIAAWFSYRFFRTRILKQKLPLFKSQGALFIDVRSPAEFQTAHAKGSVNIPVNDISNRLSEIPRSAPVVVACASGSRSAMARMMLKRHGYKEVYNLGNWANLEVK